jgi:hypothetical protein
MFMGLQSPAKLSSQSSPLRGKAWRAAAYGLRPSPSVVWGRKQGRMRRPSSAAAAGDLCTLSNHVGGMAVRAPRSRTGRLSQWRGSAEFRRIAQKSAKANLAQFEAAPRCGAKRKRDGEPCCKPAMANGRCRNHGGATPSGSAWHVPQYADPSTPRGERKLNRKLRAMQRYAETRAARLVAMSDADRERHLAWHRTHPAGGNRASRRAKSDQAHHNEAFRRLIAGEPSLPTTDTEKVRVNAELAAARARLATLETRNAEPSNDEGVFS